MNVSDVYLMLTLNGVSFSYGRKKIIEDLSFSVAQGECVVLAGPNGSGKSTALSIIAGVLKPSRGTVDVKGKLGYVPQGSALLEDATVKENLKFFASVTHGQIPEKLPFSVEKYLKKKVSRLSGGMSKQVSIACALLGDPNIILLDEPCAALDISFRDEMIKLVCSWKEEGKAIVYVGHDPAEFYPFYDKLVLPGISRTVLTRGVDDAEADTEEKFVRFYKEYILTYPQGDN